MRSSESILSWSLLLASLGGVQAKLDLKSSKNVVVYWGQNSLENSSGGKKVESQKSLAYYCDNEDIDVIPMAFDMMVNGPGGAPEIDFANSSGDCEVFEGTQLKNCPNVGADIKTCQQKGKTILLSIGGATYSEGGFKSEADAKDGAKLMWETFGPKQAGSEALRPFGDAALNGFDFDFEANVQHMAPFANELRSLIQADKSGQDFFLTAAPQCPYPDQSDKEILNGPVYIDAIWVQFYNNYCGVNAYSAESSANKFNFEEWDNWAHTVSNNKDVKVLLGVPADTTAASTGYIPSSELAKVIEYSKKFDSFGGVMMWDATQAYGNGAFIKDVSKALGGADDTGSSSSTSASTSAPSSSSTDTANTSSSSNAPGSSPSSSSSSAASSSSSGPEPTSTESPTPADTTSSSTTSEATEAQPTTAATPEATAPPATTAPPVPAPTSTEQTPPPASTEQTPTPASTEQTPASTSSTPAPSDDPDQTEGGGSENSDPEDLVSSILGNDLLGLLGGLRTANTATHRVTHSLTNKTDPKAMGPAAPKVAMHKPDPQVAMQKADPKVQMPQMGPKLDMHNMGPKLDLKHIGPNMKEMGPKLDLNKMGPQDNGPKQMGPNANNLRRALRNRV
ncbi:uncharacterized protein N7511_000148 [Penicillium nucicola]|uniref:uncharacterized protein n=1 Tax=Penicillium nucicola TaxID=1850975 RepID=UPI0025454396|nr:uncharacterized protein N7511_000148 [Penicillium nucicola]KAJ5775137.1 hypothetical protein N7511_000148 [Penicillium nucicola]